MKVYNTTKNVVTAFQICKLFSEIWTIVTNLGNITADEHRLDSRDKRKEYMLFLCLVFILLYKLEVFLPIRKLSISPSTVVVVFVQGSLNAISLFSTSDNGNYLSTSTKRLTPPLPPTQTQTHTICLRGNEHLYFGACLQV